MTSISKWDSGGCVSFVMLLGLLTMAPGPVGSYDAKRELACLLRTSTKSFCSPSLDAEVPDRLVQLYSNMSMTLRRSCRRGRLSVLSPDDFAQMPAPLLLLIPTVQLKDISGSALAWSLTEHLEDTVIAYKLIEVLDFPKHHGDFLKRLEGIKLPQRTQDILAQALLKWRPDTANWNHEMFRMIEKVGDPLLAHLPPYFLPSISEVVASKFLFYFRNWHWARSTHKPWKGKLEAQKRAWTNIAIRYSYPCNLSQWTPGDAHSFSFLLEGATPDELKLLNESQIPHHLLRKSLNKLQFRTVFDILHRSSVLGSRELDSVQPEVLKLLPNSLQKFQINSTDFSTLTLQEEDSLASTKQIAEFLIVQAVLSEQARSSQPEDWGSGIEHIGKFVYALDTDVLERYSPTPALTFLLKIDSNRITARQARLLVGKDKYIVDKPELLMDLHGMLQAISSFQIVVGNMKQYFLEHLLRNLPSGSMMHTAALLHKVVMHLGDSLTIQNMLSNPQPNQFFELLTSHQVALIYPVLDELSKKDQMETAIKALPRNTLSVILRMSKERMANSSNQWTSDTLLAGKNKLGLLGMSCNDINVIEPVDFIFIMGHYSRELQKIKRVFPKDLQYCSQVALMQYLKIKANLLKDKTKRTNLDYLEPHEIEAVGGYILANLPLEDIENATYGYHILRAIGLLPITELLVATRETKPHSLAKFMLNYFAKKKLDDIEIVQLFSLGNLIHFLQPDEILKISPSAFKLFLESSGAARVKTVCGNSEARMALYEVVVKAFGKPFSWTAGVLAALGDFLLVVPGDELLTIPENSYRDAADVLVDQTSYHLHIEWPGKAHGVPFFHACSELLSENEAVTYINAVHWLARWRLMALQSQMETILNAQNFLRSPRVAMLDIEVPSKTVVSVLEPSLERAFTELNEQEVHTSVSEDNSNSTGTTSDYLSTDRHLVEEPSEIERGANTLSSHSSATEDASKGLLARISETVSVLESKVQNKLDVQNEADLSTREKRKIEEILHEHEELLRWSNIQQEQLGDLLRENVLASRNTSGVTNHRSVPALTTTEYPQDYVPGPWPRVSCNAIRAAGFSAAIGLDENDIRGMDLKEIDKCIDTFGSLELSGEVRKIIWSRMDKEKFREELSLTGNLVHAIDEQDISKINLNLNSLHGLDNLATLSQHVKDSFLLEAISIRFTKSNPSLRTITTETAIALGRILCEILAVPDQQMLFEHSVFFNASPILGKIEDCPTFCLKKLTHLATKEFAFGSPETWTADDLATLGTIVAGLKTEQWRQIASEAFVGLSPAAVKCIPATIFKELSEEQLKSLPLLSAAVVSEVQLSYLSMQQRAALDRIVKHEPMEFARASSIPITKDILLVIVSVISLLCFV